MTIWLGCLAIIVTDVVWPNAIHAAPRPIHWLTIALLGLVFANWCGLSRWLFRRGNKIDAAVKEGQN